MTTDARQLLLLLTWMSPAFPTGAFAYSHGLEWAIGEGKVRNGADTEAWIADLLVRGSGWNDAVLFARCWQDDPAGLNALALALCSSRERHLETVQLGRAFRIAARTFTSDQPDSFPGDDAVAYPVASGHACASMQIDVCSALIAYMQSLSATLTSVAVRLVPIGQTAGLAVLRNLAPVIAATASRAAEATLDDLGAITLASDIAAMRHETQPTRIFRT